nr:bifunctional folylpolyglutamate synthase/dihydrofolate synthase [Treponemataceae bacterium]
MQKKISLSQFEKWLDSFLNFEKTPEKNIFWLDTMQFIANEFGNPQNSYKIIHVAGSKGKGSVSTYLSNILSQDGFKTGLYTSPHLFSFFERISLDGKKFSKASYQKAAQEMYDRREIFTSDRLPAGRKVTWFELVTLYAFLVFRQEKCDWVVLETGLGGRLDATNICKPELCLLTPIELEHTEFLGNTIELIAGEKAGIIKEKTPVYSARQKESVRKVFEDKAKEKNASIEFADDFIKNLTCKFDDSGNNIEFSIL